MLDRQRLWSAGYFKELRHEVFHLELIGLAVK